MLQKASERCLRAVWEQPEGRGTRVQGNLSCFLCQAWLALELWRGMVVGTALGLARALGKARPRPQRLPPARDRLL